MSTQAKPQDTKYASPTDSNQSRTGQSNEPKGTKADQSSSQSRGGISNEPRSSDKKVSNY